MRLLNAFSIQMLPSFPATVTFTELDREQVGDLRDLESAIGHADLARILDVPMNRVPTKLAAGESAIIAQFMGGRLPEGASELPPGFSIRWFRVDVLDLECPGRR